MASMPSDEQRDIHNSRCGWLDMASFTGLCILTLIFVSSSLLAAENICTSEWDVSVEGARPSQLRMHHMSYTHPGKVSFLQWDWSWYRKLAGTFWTNQEPLKGVINGGFTVQPKSLFHFPASFTWTLHNGTLYLTTQGAHEELAAFPAWRVSVCNDLLIWGITADKDLYVQYGDVNETQSLDESWAEEIRFKRQAEFPTIPQQPGQPTQSNSTIAKWWRSFLETIGANNQGDRARSWAMDLTELILKLVFSGVRNQQYPNIPKNPNAEGIPGQSRDVEDVSSRTPFSRNPRKVYSLED